jgi:hypothetical protein
MARINRWVLRTSPEVVRLLERQGNVEENGFCWVKREKPMGFEKMLLIVPPWIEVYDAIGYNNERPDGNIFFASDINDDGTAYASVIYRKGDGLNYARNTAVLFNCPWYDANDSARMFTKLAERKHNNLLVGSIKISGQKHPLNV